MFFDFMQAFDPVTHTTVHAQLKHKGVSGINKCFMSSQYSNKSLKYNVRYIQNKNNQYKCSRSWQEDGIYLPN